MNSCSSKPGTSWPVVRFRDVLREPLRNGIYKTKEFHGRGQKVINMGELFSYDFISGQEMKRVELNDREKSTSLVEDGDLLFARRSLVLEGSGKCSIVVNPMEETTFESSIIRARLDADKAVPRFFYYFFGSPQGRGLMASIATRTAVSGITGSDLSQLLVPLPPKHIQRAAAGWLMEYDSLIENNTRRIKILEEMAKMIYREWFVDFRFPGHEKVKMAESDLGLVPDGWDIIRVEDAVQRFPSGKKFDQRTVLPMGLVPVLDQGKSGVIGYHNEAAGVEASYEDPIVMFANHTCYQRLILFPFSAIQNVLPFRSSTKYQRDIYWLHWATKDLVRFNDYKGHWPEFVNKRLSIPPPDVCSLFGNFVKPIAQSCHVLEKQNKNLRQTRDLLLPMLISGEVGVEQFEAEAVAQGV
jgi:type I restriction enzyme S subunit